VARQLDLKTVMLDNPLTGTQTQLVYGEILTQVLRLSSGAGQGLTLDEVEKVMDALAPIKEAMEANSDKVTLNETQYKTLLDKLNLFQFAFAADEIVNFGRMVRNAPEIGTEASGATPIRRTN